MSSRLPACWALTLTFHPNPNPNPNPNQAADETFRQIRPFDGPVKLLYNKKGGREKVFAKFQAYANQYYRPRVRRVFQRLLAEEGQKDAPSWRQDLEIARQDLEMTAATEPGSLDVTDENGGDANADAHADANAGADADADVADISGAVARAVQRSAAAKGIAQVQAEP